MEEELGGSARVLGMLRGIKEDSGIGAAAGNIALEEEEGGELVGEWVGLGEKGDVENLGGIGVECGKGELVGE